MQRLFVCKNFDADLRKRKLRSGFKKRMEEKEVRGIIGAVAIVALLLLAEWLRK